MAGIIERGRLVPVETGLVVGKQVKAQLMNNAGIIKTLKSLNLSETNLRYFHCVIIKRI